jgi:hypothetical protein
MSTRSRVIIVIVGGDYNEADSLASSAVRKRAKMYSRLAE